MIPSLRAPCSLTLAFGLGLAAAPAQMIFDMARNRMVIPGAEWDGARWGEKAMPPASVAVLVNDPVRQRVVGMGLRVMEWDGHAWTTLLATSPSVGAAVYVHSTGQILTLRSPGNNVPCETWVWAGQQWQRITTAHAPAFSAALADDPVRNRVVAVGMNLQLVPTPVLSGQLWEFDGVDWSLMQGLPNSLLGTVVHDPVRGVVQLFGRDAVGSWDGLNLTTVTTPALSTNLQARFAFDPIRGEVVRYTNAANGTGDALHAWNGSTWQPFGYTRAPEGALPVYDEARDRLVLLDNASASIHEWDGARWRTSPATNGPVLTGDLDMTYDAVGRRTLVFSSSSGLWSWDGTAWQQQPALPGAPLSSARIACDRARGRIVLWGYRSSTSECWEFDGQAWIQTAAPVARSGQARLGYDIARQRTVLMSGSIVEVTEFDGTTWTTPVPSPVAGFSSSSATVAYDPVRGGVLYSNYSGYQFWNGQTLTTISVPTAARPPNDRLVFDSRRQTLAAVGSGKVWREVGTAAAVADYGTACGRSGDSVSLAAYGLPRTNATFELDVRAAAASQPFAVVLGLGQASVPIGAGCTLLVQNAAATLFAFTNAAGFGHQPITVPDRIVLRGLVVQAQAAVLDPLAPLGFALTQGLDLVIGD